MKKSNPDWESEPKAPVVEVTSRLSQWFPELSKETVEKLVIYQENLLKFTKVINLISANTMKTAESVHIADSVFASLLMAPVINAKQAVYDFGAGNGCPGIVFAALNPTRSVILVDRDKRKMEFCKHAASMMGLKNLTVNVVGVEELPVGSVHNAISRGFAPFSRALLICRKQFPKGGRFLHMKTDGWANELAQMPSQFFTHWGPSLIGKYRLPDSTSDMFVVLTEKLTD